VRGRMMLALVFVLAAVVAALPASAADVATTTRLYMSNDSTACPGSPYLGLTAGSGEPRCGFQGGAPFGELYHNGGPVADTRNTFATREDFPAQLLDAARDITGNVRVYSWSQTNRAAVGQVRVDVTLTGTNAAGESVPLGTSSSTQTITPANSAMLSFPFTMPVADTLDRTSLTAVTALVDIRGAHVFSGYHQLNGESFADLPVFTPEPAP
jgi:opacity protein-like surface antigen